MDNDIKPELCTIENYLKTVQKRTFLVPEYQRAYVWKKEHCDKLWSDIEAQINRQTENEKDSNYFFGTVIINCGDQNKELALIDGQQRTTTFILLLKALLLNINDTIPKIKTDEESATLLRGLKKRRTTIIETLYRADTDDIEEYPNPQKDKIIQKDTSIYKNQSCNDEFKDEVQKILENTTYDEIKKLVFHNPEAKEDNKYSQYFKNFKFFYDKAKELSAPELNKFTKVLTGNCQIIQIKSWNFDQAVNMFNSLNGDGEPLRDSDIIFAKLYSEALSKNQKDSFLKIWKDNREKLGNLYKRKIFIPSNSRINKNLLDKNPDFDPVLDQYMFYLRAKKAVSDGVELDTTTPGLRNFFSNNVNYPNNVLDFSNKILNILEVWEKLSNYNTLCVLLKFNQNFKHFIPSYFLDKLYLIQNDNEANDKEINNFLNLFLRLFTLYEIDEKSYSSGLFKTFLLKRQVQFVNNNINLQEISNEFDKHIKGKWDIETVKKLIYSCTSDALVFLNDFLFAKEINYKFVISQPEIEHIMCRCGRNSKTVRDNANIKSENEFKNYLNMLGNKILLELEINRGVGNAWFKSKLTGTVSDENNRGYGDSIYPFARYLVDKYKSVESPQWTKELIEEYTEKACDRIAKFIFNI